MRRNGSHLTRPAVRMLADAAVYGNCFQWHVDADPAGLATARVPPWLARHGAYANGTAGKPLFVSLLVYLDELWRQEWDAETLFLEPAIGAGFLVQPRPGRAVLMHQDGAPYAPEARLLRRAFARKPVIRIAPWLSGSATPVAQSFTGSQRLASSHGGRATRSCGSSSSCPTTARPAVVRRSADQSGANPSSLRRSSSSRVTGISLVSACCSHTLFTRGRLSGRFSRPVGLR